LVLVSSSESLWTEAEIFIVWVCFVCWLGRWESGFRAEVVVPT